MVYIIIIIYLKPNNVNIELVPMLLNNCGDFITYVYKNVTKHLYCEMLSK